MASFTTGTRMGPHHFCVDKDNGGTVFATLRAPRKAMPPSFPPPPFLLLLGKAVEAVEAQKKKQDDKDKKKKELIMEINRLKAKVDDAPVKQELIKLRDWVYKEAMTDRGRARMMLSVEWPILS